MCRSNVQSELRFQLKNDSGTAGYVGLQLMKGRIIVIDNEVSEKMIVKEKYVLAHTPNTELISYPHVYSHFVA